MTKAWDAVVIGAGPAGLMAAEELGRAGHRVLVAEAKPSVARKLLMAGKSGLNLTKDEPFEQLIAQYGEAAEWLAPMICAFDAQAVQDWAQGLGSELFTGSTGRVFPKEMKASPLLRAWLGELQEQGVEQRLRWRWQGWRDGNLLFETPDGVQEIAAKAVVLAMGGASWARLGSDGRWAGYLQDQGIPLAPFKASNAGLLANWSVHMTPQFGKPLKGVAWHAGDLTSRGEAVISSHGLEGGGIYSICAAVREGAALTADLLPDLALTEVQKRLSRPRGKASLANHLRKSLKLEGARLALLQEFGRPLPKEEAGLAALIKALPVKHAGLRPLDEAISTAGGVPWAELDTSLMLQKIRGCFCAGEMIDWDAPTGGYLLQACFSTGIAAAKGMKNWLESRS